LYLGIGWKLRDTEASKLALIVNRIGGFVLLSVGLMILI